MARYNRNRQLFESDRPYEDDFWEFLDENDLYDIVVDDIYSWDELAECAKSYIDHNNISGAKEIVDVLYENDADFYYIVDDFNYAVPVYSSNDIKRLFPQYF